MFILIFFWHQQTRTGLGFSPWTSDIGPPIHAPDDFDLEARIKAVLRETEDGSPVGDSLPVGDELLHSHHDSADPDEPVLAAPADMAASPLSLDHLFDSFAKVDNPSAAHAAPAGSVDVGSESKKTTHARKHNKEHRNGQRDRRALTSLGLANSSKPLKKSALKKLLTTVALQSDCDVEAALVRDDNAFPAQPDVTPIETDLSLEMEDVPVASSAFVGRLIKQTPEDRARVDVDELRKQEGWGYKDWNGK